LLTSALAGVDLDPQHPAYIRGVAALGRAHAFTGNLPQARRLGAEAVDLARAGGGDRLLAATLQIGMQDGLTPENLSDKLARASELTRLSEQVGDPRHLGPAAYYRATIAYVRCDPVGLATAHNDLARAARATGQPFWEWVESCLTFGTQFLRADFTAAMRTIAAAHELGRSFGPGSETDGPAGLQTFMVRREAGRLDQVRALISGEEDPTRIGRPGCWRCTANWGCGNPRAASWVRCSTATCRAISVRPPGRLCWAS
jgi:hypothetical protein